MKNYKGLLALGLSYTVLLSCNNDNSITERNLYLLTSSNTSGKISYTNLLAATSKVESFSIVSADADGISYDPISDAVVLASRSNNRLEAYARLRTTSDAGLDNLTLISSSSGTDFTNARETAVFNDIVVVAQDQSASNNLTDKLFVYQKSSTGFTLLKTFSTTFKLWGIHLDGTDLYAVVDLTGDVAQFENFLNANSGAIMPTKRISIEGINRIHGITYSTSDDVMILTDIASATSASDGGFVVLPSFSNLFALTANGGTLKMDKQLRVYGPNSQLGNPVDVAYDKQSQQIFIAENLKNGGQVMHFRFPSQSGDSAPLFVRAEAGVSSIFATR